MDNEDEVHMLMQSSRPSVRHHIGVSDQKEVKQELGRVRAPDSILHGRLADFPDYCMMDLNHNP